MVIHDRAEPGYSYGGKASNLFLLKDEGFNVPPFIVIPAEEHEAVIANHSDPFKAVREFIFPADLKDTITKLLPQAESFAVRSSFEGEDGPVHSYAGQFESYLFVRIGDVTERVKDVWLSLWSERVSEYRRVNDIRKPGKMSVIIQEMISADVSGVAFSVNPVNGDRSEKIISASWGAAEALVSGEINGDTYYIKNNRINSNITPKTTMFTRSHKLRGAAASPVDAGKINIPCLQESQLKEIAALLDRLYKQFFRYQDVEFSYAGETLFVLQSRPVTALFSIADKSGAHIIWDNSNIVESYPGITTPLTFSFISRMYEAVYRQMMAIMGVSEKEVENNREIFANMLGLLDGRVYYNLLNWHRALALLPGYALNAEFMEKMMGVKEHFDLPVPQNKNKFRERLRVVRMIIVMVRNFSLLGSMRADFRENFESVMKKHSSIDLSGKNPGELMEFYLEFEQTMLKKWKAPLVNDFYAMIFFGVTQKLAARYGLPPGIHNDLLSGAKDIISTEPVRLSLELSTMILKDDQAKELFLNNSSEVIWKKLGSAAPLLKKRFEEYIDSFGARCVGELKLETVTYKQYPEAFVKIIQGYVKQGITSETHNFQKTETRSQAEKKIKTTLASAPIKRIIFSYFLSRSRVLVSERENLRFERTRAFNRVREIFTAMGLRFFADGIIAAPRDIFYLTKQEIFGYIRGTAVTSGLTELIELRKKEFGKFELRSPSERIHTYGSVYQGNNFYEAQQPSPGGGLRGIAASPGRVKARVQVVHNPGEVTSLNGDILVTGSTDPGWVTLFPGASGILVERGSLLSHSAIVSREMGKPCIVGISGLLTQLHTGDLVEMDGASGEVNIIEE